MRFLDWKKAGITAVLLLVLAGGVNAGAFKDSYAAYER